MKNKLFTLVILLNSTFSSYPMRGAFSIIQKLINPQQPTQQTEDSARERKEREKEREIEQLVLSLAKEKQRFIILNCTNSTLNVSVDSTRLQVAHVPTELAPDGLHFRLEDRIQKAFPYFACGRTSTITVEEVDDDIDDTWKTSYGKRSIITVRDGKCIGKEEKDFSNITIPQDALAIILKPHGQIIVK